MAVTIDIVSDSVCPWCFIGKRQLESALGARPDLEADIHWHPFQLNPDMPDEGQDYRDYYEKKFGGREKAKQIVDHMTEAGESVGIEFRFDRIKTSPNTFDSHRLIRWAGSAGVQDAVVEAIFRAYFLEGRDIGDVETLVDIARDTGMDADLVEKLFTEGRDVDLIKGEIAGAAQIGITGVPFFILGHKLAISGAQEPSVFLQAFDKVVSEARKQSEPIIS